MDSQTTRATLLMRVRDPSDAAAWQEFDARYRDLILGYCLARGLQHADAEDVRQVVMLNLMSALRKFEYEPQRGRFRHYLGRVVRNAVNRHFARPFLSPAALDSTVISAVPIDDPDATDTVWEKEWTDHHYRMAMQTIRNTFDAPSIEIFERLLTGESVDAVAASRATTPAAVHKVKQRIRDRMKELIALQIRDEDLPHA